MRSMVRTTPETSPSHLRPQTEVSWITVPDRLHFLCMYTIKWAPDFDMARHLNTDEDIA